MCYTLIKIHYQEQFRVCTNQEGFIMKEQKIADGIVYIGVNDRTIDLFESQYVVPNGVSYNSYCILDE